MKITATAIGGSLNRKTITGYGHFYRHPKSTLDMSTVWGFPENGFPPTVRITYEEYRYERFACYGKAESKPYMEYGYWVLSSLTWDDAWRKIMEGYSAVIPNPISQDYGAELKKHQSFHLTPEMVATAADYPIVQAVDGIVGTANQEYRKTLKESGIFDKPNPLLDLQGKEGTIKTNVPGEQEDDYDPWDSKNWGL